MPTWLVHRCGPHVARSAENNEPRSVTKSNFRAEFASMPKHAQDGLISVGERDECAADEITALPLQRAPKPVLHTHHCGKKKKNPHPLVSFASPASNTDVHPSSNCLASLSNAAAITHCWKSAQPDPSSSVTCIIATRSTQRKVHSLLQSLHHNTNVDAAQGICLAVQPVHPDP